MKLIFLLATVALCYSAKTRPECKAEMKECILSMMETKMMAKAEKMKEEMGGCKDAGECICPLCTKKAMLKSLEAQCPDVDMKKVMFMKAVKKVGKVMKHIDSDEIDNLDLIQNSMILKGVSCHARKMRKMAPMVCKNPAAMLACAAPIVGQKASDAIIAIMTNAPGQAAGDIDDDEEDDGDILDLGAGDDEDEGNARRKRQAESPAQSPEEAFIDSLGSLVGDKLGMAKGFGKMKMMMKHFKKSPLFRTCEASLDEECQSAIAQPPSPTEMMEKMTAMGENMSNMCTCLDNLDEDTIIKAITDDCGAPPDTFDFGVKIGYMKKKMKCDRM